MNNKSQTLLQNYSYDLINIFCSELKSIKKDSVSLEMSIEKITLRDQSILKEDIYRLIEDIKNSVPGIIFELKTQYLKIRPEDYNPIIEIFEKSLLDHEKQNKNIQTLTLEEFKLFFHSTFENFSELVAKIEEFRSVFSEHENYQEVFLFLYSLKHAESLKKIDISSIKQKEIKFGILSSDYFKINEETLNSFIKDFYSKNFEISINTENKTVVFEDLIEEFNFLSSILEKVINAFPCDDAQIKQLLFVTKYKNSIEKILKAKLQSFSLESMVNHVYKTKEINHKILLNNLKKFISLSNFLIIKNNDFNSFIQENEKQLLKDKKDLSFKSFEDKKLFTDLVKTLVIMYRTSKVDKMAMVHIFAIKYSEEIKKIKMSIGLKKFVIYSLNSKTIDAEINKGLKLVNLVKVIDEYVNKSFEKTELDECL